jgi:hypothetical protein
LSTIEMAAMAVRHGDIGSRVARDVCIRDGTGSVAPRSNGSKNSFAVSNDYMSSAEVLNRAPR